MISVQNLTYSYSSKEKTLDKLSMHVPKGAIYGFLGANGAGKSTTIRAILGLLAVSKGSIHVMGHDKQRNNIELFKSIGSLVENPSFYPNLSAKDNLRLLANYRNISKSKILEVLDRVGLAHTKNKKTAHFSMGMKQRLGLGMAMLHDPDLLILDEPVNGLDPKGISEIREIILQLKSEGKTILLSSHILSEIEKIATHVGIIQAGKMIFEDEISALHSLKNQVQELQIRVEDSSQLIEKFPNSSITISSESEIIWSISDESEIPHIINQLVQNKISLYRVELKQNNLESIFMDLTKSSDS